MKSGLIALGVAALVLACCGSVEAARLFEDGRSDWKIVYDAGEPYSPIAYGAEELQRAIEKISGAKLPAEVGKPAKETIYVGVDPSLPKAGDEVVAIRLKGDAIELVGNEPRGALHAVYGFLQRELGVRWLWATESGEFMPKLDRWEVPKRAEWRHTPSIRYRGFHLCGDWFQRQEFLTWMSRNFMTAHRHGEYTAPEHRFGFYHYLSAVLAGLPKNGTFEQHPEYFCEIGGKRLRNNVCFSSEACAELAGRQMAGLAKGNKRNPVEILQFFLVDNQDYCKCEKCRRMSVSEGYYRFFNRAAAVFRKECPNVKLATLAYQQYCPAPDFAVDADFVEYATHDRCNLHGLASPCRRNAEIMSALDGWGRLGIPLGEYGYNFDSFWTRDVSTPFFHIIDDQVANAVKRRFVSLIVEAGLSPRHGPEEVVSSCFNRIPELYYARKMWDASLTADAFLDDVTRTAYGPAAAPMKRYFQIMDAAWGRDPDHHVGILTDGISHVRKILLPQVKEAASAALQEASAKIGGATAQQQAAFRREQVLFKQWTDLLDLANGNAQIVRLPQVTCPGKFPESLGKPETLVADGKATSATVRAAWTADRLFVEFAGVGADAKAAEVRLRAPASGHRYSFRLARDGARTQEHVSEVGIADTAYAPAWTGGFKGDRVRLAIPIAAFAEPPKKGTLRMTTHFTLEGKRRADYPAQADVHVETVFTTLKQVDVPLFYHEAARTALPFEKVRVMMSEGGWKGDYTTDEKEVAKLVRDDHRAFWFRNVSLRGMDAKAVETVRRAVHDKGAVVLFTGYMGMDVGGFLGDPSYSCKMVSPAGVPLPMRVPTSVEEGPWMTAAYDMTKDVRGRTPAYAQVPDKLELWTVCCREKARDGGEIPYLSYRRYGKGIVIVGGESLAFNVYRLLTNFLRLAEQR